MADILFEPLRVLRSGVVVLPGRDIDTDQIFPARFMTTTEREGLGRLLFYDWRFDSEGGLNACHVINALDPQTHRILVAGHNFGSGSSREHAAWSLRDFGFRVIISSGIADIFAGNAMRNGLLTITVDEEVLAALLGAPDAEVTVDLESRRLRSTTGLDIAFDVDSFARICLMEGRDPLAWLLGCADDIAAYELVRDGTA